jgi:hypothetical protein
MRAADPVALAAWYRDCLGLDADEHGLWHPESGPTVFAKFAADTDYFGSPEQQTMLTSGSATSMPCSPSSAPRERT